VVLGSGLDAVERDLHNIKLKFVKSVPRRFAGLLNTHIATVTITFTKENGMNQESSLNLQTLGKYPVVMTKEKVPKR